ncbi:hypothetical protein INR49_029151 [Caranx melampygus]|nr:hypothetical protein INR49_029151 [Caranx melampygus]
MSCCSCCCVAPGKKSLKGVRKKKWLVREEEEEEDESRRIVDVSLLREHYRSSRERQRHTQMLQYRKFSEELSEAISVIPFTPPVITFDPVPLSYNPWQVHLDLHQCSCSDVPVQLPASSLETNTSITGSSSSKEGDYFNTERPRDPDFRGGPASSTVDQVQFYITRSLSGPEQSTSDGSRRDPPDDSQESLVSASLTSSDPSSPLWSPSPAPPAAPPPPYMKT